MNKQSNFVGYAGFWKRFTAYCIDSTLLIIIYIVTWFIIVSFAVRRDIAVGIESILGSVLTFIYFVGMESSSKQATLGKMAIGVIVTDLEGNRISFWRAFRRYWCKIISTLLLCVGFLMTGWTRKKQALHDIITGCLVINKELYLPQFTTKYNNIGYTFTVVLSILLSSYFYFQLYKRPIAPALQISWIYNIYVPLGFIAYSSAFVSFILSMIGLIKNNLPKVILRLQLLTFLTFLLSVVFGAIWAESVWGKYWSWDPKETWSLVLLYIIIPVFLFIKFAKFKWVWLWALSIQLVVVIFVIWASCTTLFLALLM